MAKSTRNLTPLWPGGLPRGGLLSCSGAGAPPSKTPIIMLSASAPTTLVTGRSSAGNATKNILALFSAGGIGAQVQGSNSDGEGQAGAQARKATNNADALDPGALPRREASHFDQRSSLLVVTALRRLDGRLLSRLDRRGRLLLRNPSVCAL
jgi:hypothetical protein